MIGKNVQKFCCEPIENIENYFEAVNDETQIWECHHRRETDENKSRKELILMNYYYNVKADELIFLTRAEHNILHHKGNQHCKGKHTPKSTETKAKMREAKIGKYDGENNPNYKYHITKEELYNLYIYRGLFQYQIAKIYGCSPFCIHNKLKKYKIIK